MNGLNRIRIAEQVTKDLLELCYRNIHAVKSSYLLSHQENFYCVPLVKTEIISAKFSPLDRKLQLKCIHVNVAFIFTSQV